jgi:hypothetical protein
MQSRNGSYRQNHPVRERNRYNGYRFETVRKQFINIISNIALNQILMAGYAGNFREIAKGRKIAKRTINKRVLERI